jgi:hypothetical protein
MVGASHCDQCTGDYETRRDREAGDGELDPAALPFDQFSRLHHHLDLRVQEMELRLLFGRAVR